jgi:hypothetical protein
MQVLNVRLYLLLLLVLPAIGLAQGGKLYRWTDPDGRIFYSDRVPPQFREHAHSELTSNGVEIAHRAAALTREQIETRQRIAALRTEEARLQREIDKRHALEQEREAERDRVLLQTFGSEAEIIEARDSRLQTVDVIIHVASSNIDQLTEQIAKLQRNAADYELSGRGVPQQVLDEIENSRAQIAEARRHIASQTQARARIEERFSEHLQRYHRLVPSSADAAQNTGLGAGERRPPVEGAAFCAGPVACREAWSRAKQFVQEHATTDLQLVEERLILTEAPRNDSDLAMAVSRVVVDDESERLTVKLECLGAAKGQGVCRSRQAELVRANFRSFVERDLPAR